MADMVLDASVALAWLFEDETDARAEAVADALGRDRTAAVPMLWYYEMANAILTAARKGRLPEDRAREYWDRVAAMPLEVDERQPGTQRMFRFAADHGLTAYDAAYLDLAAHLRCPLATLDKRLIAAAKAAGIAVWRS